jgi:predicted short-subunit dehydrogenase-like oxidoreductase (DUF2520 family)
MVAGPRSRPTRRPRNTPSIAILGAGRLGTALAKRLSQAGYRVQLIHSRSREKLRALASDLVWFCVPDGEISPIAAELAGRGWAGKTAFHSSGVLPSDILAPLASSGARVASVHPLMTFVQGSLPRLNGVSFAVEGDKAAVRVAERIVRRLGGDPVPIAKSKKAAYHAFATMVCPLVLAWLQAAEQTAALAGMRAQEARRRMRPIVLEALANYTKLGAARAMSGPLVRGDAPTVASHLDLLAQRPAIQRAYAALVETALETLPAKNKRALRELLERVNRARTRGSSRRRGRAMRRAARQS